MLDPSKQEGMGDRERVDECPSCGTIGYAGWVLGHHYCPGCDHTFLDDGEVICEGRHIDNV